MKNTRLLVIIFMISSLYNCKQETNKTSRQFEKLIQGTTLSSDSKEITLDAQVFYVLESIGENLFNKEGYFIAESTETTNLIDAIIRSNVRSIIGKYSVNELINVDKTKIEKEIEDLCQSIEFESDFSSKFKIVFNAILVKKIEAKKD